MRFLAAWMSQPNEYWPNLVVLAIMVVIGFFVLRKVRANSKHRNNSKTRSQKA
jgi:hypothetical protein